MKDKDHSQPPLTGAKEAVSAFLRARLNSRASNALSSASRGLRFPLAIPSIRDLNIRLRHSPENASLECSTSSTLVSTTYYQDTSPLPLGSNHSRDIPQASCRIASDTSPRHRAALVRRTHASTSPFPIVLDVASRSLPTLEFAELWDPLHPSFFTALAQCSSVTTLRLNAAWLYNFHQLRRLVSALPGLKHLHIGDVNSQLQHDTADGLALQSSRRPLCAPVPTRLEELVMHVSSSVHPIQHVAFIHWLTSTSVCESLKTLRFMGPRDISETLVTQASLLIKAVGPSLQDLRTPYLCYVEHDLSRNNNLLSLDFKIYIHGWESFLDDLLSILSTISSPHLVRIRILCNWEPTTLQDIPLATELEPLHRVMKRSNFNSLTGVEVNVTAAEYTVEGDGTTEIEAGFRAFFVPWGRMLGLRMLIERDR